MNKMQHQYIQNLQKANMTLKCKIKEVGEIADGFYTEKASEAQKSAHASYAYEEKEFSEEKIGYVDFDDEEFEMQALGTIEEIAQ